MASVKASLRVFPQRPWFRYEQRKTLLTQPADAVQHQMTNHVISSDSEAISLTVPEIAAIFDCFAKERFAMTK